jgi:uncharacterized protein YdaU (DUF1376 family)
VEALLLLAELGSWTQDLFLYGEPVERLIARNGQRLSDKDAAKEEEKIEKLMNERRNESEADRQKRLHTQEKERQEAREFVLEIAQAFDFRLAGVESMDRNLCD